MKQPAEISKRLKDIGHFREDALRYVAEARKSLEICESENSIFIALQLRMALESLVGECAAVYAEELTNDDLKIWHPRTLIRKLIEIDPLVGVELEIKIQNTDGEFVSIGSQKSISLRTVEKHYSNLSKIIHRPSLQQIIDGNLTPPNSIEICSAALKALDRVLASTLWNVSLSPQGFINFGCPECGAKVRRRLTALGEGPFQKQESLTAPCPSCRASFEIRRLDNEDFGWAPKKHSIRCPTLDCGKIIKVWNRNIREGEFLTCDACGKTLKFSKVLVLKTVE